MPRFTSPVTSFHTILKQFFTIRFLIVISCISFIFSVLWIESIKRKYLPSTNEIIVQEAIENVARDIRYFDVYRKVENLPKHLKYILLWTSKDFSPFYLFGSGQRGFLNNNCSVINCYVTDDRNLFNGDITKFDAIAFNGRNMKYYDLPTKRAPHQKYIYVNMESNDNYPVCNAKFDNFFNLTSTYRLDSDIPLPYILIKNSNGDIVGPKIDMEWDEDMTDVDEELPYRIHNKSKAVAWFVSHCTNKNGRYTFVKNLRRALNPYGLDIDIYGSCGHLQCPIERKSECDIILERDYYFYLSLENSFDKDYVTEKLLTALQHDVVPIVYGGANYSRFLPPGSYLDARQYSVQRLAATIAQLINSPKLYRSYFRWKYHYTYHDPQAVENVCAMCAALNNKFIMQTPKVYRDFRTWWNPDYAERCHFWAVLASSI
ncbi:alpha-(1,3)-fucosyltransferase C-like [Galleria mellonella]|uniref:Fucosyltransferase n=1 Tax=Galleria mellonella TaxID=7137 RepID=A0A6J1WLL5_GALME|nr:alpha-(1,3)-fucosyltransferase C-like [Galleria mellonella]XP_026755798.1 alpha-(1,3)-fucosyltransferase C-like [Galleria mellonella]XP_026755799.1 alpha-(1,3)-fucosyltransferase C-like [Galleria mellonella]